MNDNDSNDYVPVFPISPAAKAKAAREAGKSGEQPETPAPSAPKKPRKRSAGKGGKKASAKPEESSREPSAADVPEKAADSEKREPEKRKAPPRSRRPKRAEPENGASAPVEAAESPMAGEPSEDREKDPERPPKKPRPRRSSKPKAESAAVESAPAKAAEEKAAPDQAAPDQAAPDAVKPPEKAGAGEAEAAPAHRERRSYTTPQTMDTMPESSEELREASLEELPEDIRQAVVRAGWPALTPVQSKSIGPVMEGRDVMVQARTGSGKTGAFVLPILHRIDRARKECQALVMLPTRELARQVAAEAEMLAGDEGVSVCAVYGGVGFKPQEDALRGGAQLVVGTPGRVLDHLLRRTFNLDGINTLVFDEADRMLSIGFYPDMLEVKRYLPRRPVNSLMFSATYPPHVMRLSDEFLRDPLMISLSGDSLHVAEVQHVYYEVPGMGRDRSLIRIIESENPTSAIIFCNTKSNVHYLAEVLQQFGYDADALSADLSQSKREEVLGRVRQGNLRFLVATDVAARGIDIPDLSHVFQYETPEDPESYIHRAGRTGRAGASGVAVTLVDVMQKMEIRRIGTRYKIPFEERTLPTDAEIQSIVGDRLTALLGTRHRALKPLQKERLMRFVRLAGELGSDEKGALLVAMLLDEHYQNSLHTPPPRPKSQPADAGRAGSRENRAGARDNRAGARDNGFAEEPAKPKRKRRPRRRRKPDGDE